MIGGINLGKKITLVLGFLVCFVIGTIVGMILPSEEKEEEPIQKTPTPSSTYLVETEEKEGCGYQTSLYYEGEDKNVYLYCLDSMKVAVDGKLIELRDYIDSNSKNIDKSLEILTSNTKLWNVSIDKLKDGGTAIYKDDGESKMTNHGLTLITCNTLEGGKNVYIGPYDMTLRSHYCMPNAEEDKDFIRTYQVLYKAADTNRENIFITIQQYNTDDIETVKIPYSLASKVQVKRSYEFTFAYDGKAVEDTIDSIFENTKLVSIVETDKVGERQIQEAID